jgi:hypothetical protein
MTQRNQQKPDCQKFCKISDHFLSICKFQEVKKWEEEGTYRVKDSWETYQTTTFKPYLDPDSSNLRKTYNYNIWPARNVNTD